MALTPDPIDKAFAVVGLAANLAAVVALLAGARSMPRPFAPLAWLVLGLNAAAAVFSIWILVA